MKVYLRAIDIGKKTTFYASRSPKVNRKDESHRGGPYFNRGGIWGQTCSEGHFDDPEALKRALMDSGIDSSDFVEQVRGEQYL